MLFKPKHVAHFTCFMRCVWQTWKNKYIPVINDTQGMSHLKINYSVMFICKHMHVVCNIITKCICITQYTRIILSASSTVRPLFYPPFLRSRPPMDNQNVKSTTVQITNFFDGEINFLIKKKLLLRTTSIASTPISAVFTMNLLTEIKLCPSFALDMLSSSSIKHWHSCAFGVPSQVEWNDGKIDAFVTLPVFVFATDRAKVYSCPKS